MLNLVLSRERQLAYDDQVMAEHREVLARLGFGFAPEDVADLLPFLPADGEPVTVRPLRGELPDPDELLLLEVAAQVEATLITGNAAH